MTLFYLVIRFYRDIYVRSLVFWKLLMKYFCHPKSGLNFYKRCNFAGILIPLVSKTAASYREAFYTLLFILLIKALKYSFILLLLTG